MISTFQSIINTRITMNPNKGPDMEAQNSLKLYIENGKYSEEGYKKALELIEWLHHNNKHARIVGMINERGDPREVDFILRIMLKYYPKTNDEKVLDDYVEAVEWLKFQMLCVENKYGSLDGLIGCFDVV